MTVKRLLAIGFIFCCTAIGWFLLGGALAFRTQATQQRLGREVAGNWGAAMAQPHPTLYYIAPTGARLARVIQPAASRVQVRLESDPKRKGLHWYRTYRVDFDAEYIVTNPTPIRQTIYVTFHFPAQGIRYDRFALRVDGTDTGKSPEQGRITESILLEPNQQVPVHIRYWAPGQDQWTYAFGDAPRIRNFQLDMTTDFRDINIPAGAESPTARERADKGWTLHWEYADVIGARAVGMDMPAVVNPGPVASRMTFFAPVSLLFYFTVLVILGVMHNIRLHPMHYFFLAAGCFAFQLLFAYLVDLLPVMAAFLIAAAVSLALVNGYLWSVGGPAFARLSAITQTAYMILFSYSFFFPGLTGITITLGAIATLAILMVFTAKIDWEAAFQRTPTTTQNPQPATPPPWPQGTDAG
jgi:hypothetical protein